MPVIKEIKDRVLPSNAKLVAESRKSQAEGATGNGTDESIEEKNAKHGFGITLDDK